MQLNILALTSPPACLTIKSIWTPTVVHLTRLFKEVPLPLPRSPSLQRNKQDKTGSKIKRSREKAKKPKSEGGKESHRHRTDQIKPLLGPYSSKPSQQRAWEQFGRFLFYIYKGIDGKVDNESVLIFPPFQHGNSSKEAAEVNDR